MIKYIRYKDHKTLYTDDNWKTIKEAKQETPEGKEETNQDITTETKLRYMMGNKRARVIIDELKKIRKEFNLPKKDGYGHSFEIFAVSVLYNIDYEITFNNYIINKNDNAKLDGKIDAIYWKESPVVVYQIKLDHFDLEDLKIMKNNYKEFVKTGKITSKESANLLSFCQKHKKDLKEIKGVTYKTISNNRKEDNILPKEIFDMFFENKIISKDNDIKLELSVPNNNTFAKINGKNTVFAYFTNWI